MSLRDRVIATVLALLAVSLIAAAFFSHRAAAAWPGRNGAVVYLGVRPETSNTACCSPYKTAGLRVFESGSTRVLTTDPSDADPQVSPDGRTIVFSRLVATGPGDAVRRLFAIGVGGGGFRQLPTGTPEGVEELEPSFYPSGKSIVFVRAGGGDSEGNLYSVRLDGSNLRLITGSPRQEGGPVVSPSGRQIAYTCGEGELGSRIEDVCSIRPDRTHRRVLTLGLKQGAEPFDPDFSPDGRLIAFTLGAGTASDVFTMQADGSRLGALTNRSASGRRKFPRQVGYASPAFAPGGGSLLAVARPGPGPRLVRIRLRDPLHPQPLLKGSLGSAPVWAPN
jgi:dipeptidyl aminopeptidase/acylaminoacyl peptidase